MATMNKGNVTMLSLILTALVFSGVFLGLYMAMGDIQSNYGANTAKYETNASSESQEAINKAGEISDDMQQRMEDEEFSGDNIIDLIFGGLFDNFRRLLVTIPILFTGIITTTSSTLGLPWWVQSIVTTAVITAVVFVVARLVFKRGRLE